MYLKVEVCDRLQSFGETRFLKEEVCFLFPLNLGWSWWLLWAIEYGRSDVLGFLRLGHKKPCSVCRPLRILSHHVINSTTTWPETTWGGQKGEGTGQAKPSLLARAARAYGGSGLGPSRQAQPSPECPQVAPVVPFGAENLLCWALPEFLI